MNQADLLRFVVETLEAQQLPYAVVGSFASALYGEPRYTNDIDIVLCLTADAVERLCAAFPTAEFYVSLPAAREAVRTCGQFNVIHPASGNKIDFMIARNDAWGREQIGRRIRQPILPGCEAFVASPEDVILGKLLYYREGGSEKHLRDIAAMLQISGEEIDRAYLDQWVRRLGFVQQWQAALTRVQKQ